MPSTITRLKRRPEFLRVAATRRKWVTPGLILQARRYALNESSLSGEAAFRVGFTVSRKVGNSVQRNRARRRLRSAVDQILPAHAMEGHDFVVIGRKGTLNRPFPALLKDLKTALKRLNTYREIENRELEKQALETKGGRSS